MNCYFRNTPYSGRKIAFDYSKIRKKGSPLKIGGGKAPGFKGLKNAHKKIKEILDYIIEHRYQTRLLSINAYDILMHCADGVLSGGCRRSATSVIFSKDDEDMLRAKTNQLVDKAYAFHPCEKGNDKKFEGVVKINDIKYDVIISDFELKQLQEKNEISWIHIYPHRARSNNSVLLLRDSTTEEEFKKIVEHTKQFGEPGFVWCNDERQLFNPCFEINFLPVTKEGVCGVQFCNLTSMNGRLVTSEEIFKENIEAYTIIGTLQAGYTRFPYLSKTAEELTKEEALLGCSITGMMDNPDIFFNPEIQKRMANFSKIINEEWSKKIKIKPAARITCLKPEGTTSILLSCGSGIHPHHARKYFRRVQNNKLDNVYKFFKKNNPELCEPSLWDANQTDEVITFPIEVSEKAMIKSDLTAIKHLDLIKLTQKNWVLEGSTKYNNKQLENNVSCTVLVKDDEWGNVIKYIFENRYYFAAISLLSSYGDKVYKQPPMEAIITPEDEEKWNKLFKSLKRVNYQELVEDEDKTVPQQEIACAGGNCEKF